MKKFKKFISAIMIVVAAFIAFNLVGGKQFISSAANGNITTPVPKYAYANSNGNVTVAFKSVKNATKYRIYRKTSSSSLVKIADTKSTIYVDKTAKKNVTYSYVIKSCRVTTKATYWSPSSKAVNSIKKHPKSPILKEANATDKGIKITWNPTNNTTKYYVYRQKVGANWKKIATTTKTTYTDSKIKTGVTYNYTVKAVKVIDGKSYISPYKNCLTCVSYYPAAPKMELALYTDAGARVQWSNVSNESYYIIYRRQQNFDWTQIATADANSTSYVDKTANNCDTFYYTVQAVSCVNNCSFYSKFDTNGLQMGHTVETDDTNDVYDETKVCDNSNTSATKAPTKEQTAATDMLNNVIKTQYKGLSLSVLGDSTSTFSGYTSANNSHYPTSSVTTVNGMWWKKTADKLGMNISKINAVSGRRVTDTKPGNTSAIESWSNIGSPNVLVCYVGINDFLNNVELGTYTSQTTSLTALTSDNTQVFTNAYAVMINKIRRRYPNTEIVLCTLPSSRQTNDNGDSISTWNYRIKQLAGGFGLKVIDFAKSGAASNLTDGINPNQAGQTKLYNTAINRLK